MTDSDRHLMSAIHAGDSDRAQAALAGSADPNLRDMDGNIPLHYAVYQPTIVERLLTWGSHPNAVNNRGETPLHHALRSSHLPESHEHDRREAVQNLLIGKADPNIPDATGRTPLHYAADRPREIATLTDRLLRSGADPTLPDNAGRTPLHYAAGRNADRRIHAVEHLIAKGAPIKTQDMYGNTPLHYAVAGKGQDQGRTITTLIDNGADISATNQRGQTPLDLAVEPDNPVARTVLSRHVKALNIYHHKNVSMPAERTAATAPSLADQMSAYRRSIPANHVEIQAERRSGLPGGHVTYKHNGHSVSGDLPGLTQKEFGCKHIIAHAPAASIQNQVRGPGHQRPGRLPDESGPAR